MMTLVIALAVGGFSSAQDVTPHLAAGEFGLAIQLAENAPPDLRDPMLAQVASTQASTGNPIGAARTVQGIESADQRRDAIAGARGGGAFADFQSLMDLIQTTVVPDTWEALGGPSTMAPYPAGIFVDSSGTIRQCQAFASDDAAANLRAVLAPGASGPNEGADAEAWRQPAGLRCVSLRRLLNQLTHDKIMRPHVNAGDASPAMLHMAGLSQIKYVFLSDQDVILAGPVGGIQSMGGWYRDQTSGLCTLRSDFFFTCIASAIGNQAFGCTIDPTPQGLQQAAAVAAAIGADRIPIGKAADQMATALGLQQVQVFGTAGDSPIGFLMVEADRHMKQLALGKEPMPDGVKNYLDIIEAAIDRGPPNDLLLRLWFTASPRSVRADPERTVFEIGGNPIRLSGENQRALANGQRGRVLPDAQSEAFVAEFNRHWSSIREKYPLYSALESIYRAASIAELLDRYSKTESQRAILHALASDATSADWQMPTPRQVESIAVLHSVRKGRKVHHIVVASGGVSVNGQQTLQTQLVSYPALGSLAPPIKTQPRVIQRWWWDVDSL